MLTFLPKLNTTHSLLETKYTQTPYVHYIMYLASFSFHSFFYLTFYLHLYFSENNEVEVWEIFWSTEHQKI